MRRSCHARSVLERATFLIPVILVLAGCAPIVPPSPPPQATQGLATTVVAATPADLALDRTDLPAGFQLVTEESRSPEYIALYLRPAALDENASGGNTLLSVLVNIGVYTTTAQAQERFALQGADPTASATANVARMSQSATDIRVVPFDGVVAGVDQAAAERVSFNLMGRNIYEYAHRFRLGNVLVAIVVAATGNPDEPQEFLRDANRIVQRQIDQIASAASQDEAP